MLQLIQSVVPESWKTVSGGVHFRCQLLRDKSAIISRMRYLLPLLHKKIMIKLKQAIKYFQSCCFITDGFGPVKTIHRSFGEDGKLWQEDADRFLGEKDRKVKSTPRGLRENGFRWQE
jgi:hypothetical protein